MGINDIFNTEESNPLDLPAQPPGCRETAGNEGSWGAILNQHQYFKRLGDKVKHLTHELTAQDLGTGLQQIAEISEIRCMLDAAEVVVMADTYEFLCRSHATARSDEARIEQAGEMTREQAIASGISLDTWLANMASHYYRVSPDDAHAARSSFVSEAALATRDSVKHLWERLKVAEALRHQLTDTLDALASAEITSRSALEIVKRSRGLEQEKAAQMEKLLLPAAKKVSDSAVSQRARRLREKLHPRSLEERHRDACKDRQVRFWPEKDGMAAISMRGPAQDLIAVMNTLDHHVNSFHDPDDSRSKMQVRFDTLRDALIDGWPAGGGTSLHTKVAVTLPAIEMLANRSRSLADLEGYGPVPMSVALKLAAEAPSMLRVLTDPWSGAVIDVGRKKYRPPQALRDLLRFRDQVCQFPGCNRKTEDAEVDHVDDWAKGGNTERENTKLLCKQHQMFKHVLGWEYRFTPDGSVTWYSPHGIKQVEVPSSVVNLQGFDFNSSTTPSRPRMEITRRLREIFKLSDVECVDNEHFVYVEM